MADNSIFFKIGSTFSGEGFKKAQQAVKQTSSEVKKGVASAQQMAGAFEGLDASASKSMNAMTGMLQAVLSFNATTIITQAAVTAVNFVMAQMKDEADALAARFNDLKAAMSQTFNMTLSENVKAIRNEISNLTADFDSVTKQALAFTAALEGVRSASAAGGIAQLQVEKLQAMLDAHTEAERKNVEASYDMQIAQAKLTEAEQSSAQRIEAAAEKYQISKDKVANIEEQMTILANKRADLEEVMINAKYANNDKWMQIQSQVNDLKQQEAELARKYNEAVAQSEVEEQNLNKAKEEQTTAIANATAEVKQLELKQKLENEAVEAKRYAEESAAREIEEATAAQKAEKTELQKLTDARKAAAESSKALVAAEAALQKAIKEYEANLQTNKINEAFSDYYDNKKSVNRSGTIPVEIVKGVSMQVADKAVDDAIRSGAVTTVKDADKLQRESMRATRDKMNTNSGQRAKEAARYERIMKMSEEARSEADKQFVEKYDAIKAAQDAAKDKVENAKVAVDQVKAEQEKTNTVANDIAQSLLQSLQNGTDMIAGLGALTDKVNLTGIEKNIADGNELVAKALTVQ